MIIRVILIAIILSAPGAYAEEIRDTAVAVAPAPDENLYKKDTVPLDSPYPPGDEYFSNYEMPVLIDKATNKVTYYQPASHGGWIAAGDQQAALQALYDKRAEIRKEQQLRDMQDEMDRMRRDSFGQKMEEMTSHR
ncbi:MAG: hypothetical protein WC522_04110 [Candidatus Omnitrophota bacterium]